MLSSTGLIVRLAIELVTRMTTFFGAFTLFFRSAVSNKCHGCVRFLADFEMPRMYLSPWDVSCQLPKFRQLSPRIFSYVNTICAGLVRTVITNHHNTSRSRPRISLSSSSSPSLSSNPSSSSRSGPIPLPQNSASAHTPAQFSSPAPFPALIQVPATVSLPQSPSKPQLHPQAQVESHPHFDTLEVVGYPGSNVLPARNDNTAHKRRQIVE